MRKVLVLFLFFAACSSKPVHFEGFAMHIPYKVIVEDAKKEQLKEIESAIQDVFNEINNVYNNWNPHSEISLLSQSKALEKIPLSKGLETLFDQIDELYRNSSGKFDVTVEPLTQLWREKQPPSHEKVSAILPAIGWDKVHRENHLFWKEEEKTSFDLGGIAKGLAIDLLFEELEKKGFQHFYLEWGGEIRVKGTHLSGKPWKVGIEKTNIVIDISDQAIATSGDYYQFWHVEGVDYFHIIDPLTKRPLQRKEQSISSATVIAPSCTLADGIATILMFFDTPKEAEMWVTTFYPEVKCYLSTNKELSNNF